MDWITHNIAIWEYPTAKIDLGEVDSILNLDMFNPYWTDVERSHMPILDGPGNKPEDVVKVLVRLDHLASRGRVLVHCAAGVSRSPFVLALYLVWKSQGKTSFDQAVEQVASRRRERLFIDQGLLQIRDQVLELLLNGQSPPD